MTKKKGYSADLREKIVKSGYFDASWYITKNNSALAPGCDPLSHYLESGVKLGLDPSPKFNTRWYLEQNQDVASAGINPLEHFICTGKSEGRLPVPFRDAEELAAHERARLMSEVLKSGLFDAKWYLQKCKEAKYHKLGPINHYLTKGWIEGLSPGPGFDGAWYLKRNPDVECSGINPLLHFIRQGKSEGRQPVPPQPSPTALSNSSEGIAEGGSLRAGFREFAKRVYNKMPLSPDIRFKHRLILRKYVPWLAYAPVATQSTVGNGVSRVAQRPLVEVKDSDGIWEWQDYIAIKQQISDAANKAKREVNPKPPAMLNIPGEEIRKAAKNLRFTRPAQNALVTILIPVFNNIKLTLECLASIKNNTSDVAYSILIADDCSSDETSSVLALIDGIEIVRNNRNLGFLGNCNAAYRTIETKFTVTLNNDVQVTQGWLSALLDVFNRLGDVGAVGPRIIYPSGHLQEAGCALNSDGTVEMIGLNDDPERAGYSYIRPVEYVSGACLVLKTSDIHRLEGFSEKFLPCYYEDADLCFRVRDRLGLKVYYTPRSTVIHHLSKTTASLDDSFKMKCINSNRAKFCNEWLGKIEQVAKPRILAFYLPQFHPIPENDLWWGRGFTEWTNVTKAKPNFEGHDQPRLPGELGYYDLRLSETMERQTELAKRYGIGGFCYYYYWFNGKRILEQPIERMLQSSKPEFPFCLCWANENWTKRWDGGKREVLMVQAHSPEDDIEVIKDLARYFRDKRYIRIDGRPLILVYRVALFPEFSRTADRWRRYCRQVDIGEIYIAMVESMGGENSACPPSFFDCDAAVEFPPHGFGIPTNPPGRVINPDFTGSVNDYMAVAVKYASREIPGYRRFMGVMPGWDNTARRQGNGDCFIGATPGAFQAWLEEAIRKTKLQFSGDERIIFVNAWNEWAEGAYLEPDRRFGHGYLEAVSNALDASTLLVKKGR